ncbi:MAG: cobalamin biosynthesis protein CbiL [Desulfovibrio sp.]|jgi:nickel transport protein|nr:cobalamin biosynthesis protein CbiL [Desulfovibrio sp.]
MTANRTNSAGAFLRPVLAICFVAALLTDAPALAHRVNIFAWLEGSTVKVRCDFSRGSPVRGGQITVLAKDGGGELLRGMTDSEGDFGFAVPQQARKSGLRIRVNAGSGHVNEWTMEAAEFAENRSPSIRQNPDGAPARYAEDAAAAQVPAGMPETRPESALTGEQTRRIVTEVVNAELAPLRRYLASLANPEPGLREIVGGVGWLVGLAGLFCFYKSRNKS